MKTMLGRLVVLGSAFAAMALGTTAPAASAAECTKIWGAGSSLQKVAQETVWGPKWEKLAECAAKPAIGYHPTSSGKGKAQWGYETKELLEEAGTETLFPAFVGTDLAPTAKQIENMGAAKAGNQLEPKTAVMAIPVAQSAITVMISLPKTCTATEGAAAEVVAAQLKKELEEGLVTYESLIKGSTCKRSPKVEVRSSNSGTTAGFKHYEYELSEKLKPWKEIAEEPLASEEPKWPAALEADEIEWEKEGVLEKNVKALHKCCEKGSQLAEEVLEHPGEIGYADLSDAAATGRFTTTWAKHKNAKGEEYLVAIARIEAGGAFENPEEAGKGSKCKETTYAPAPEKVAPGEDWSNVKQSNVNAKGAYPICTLTFDLAWHHYKPVGKYKEAERNTVLDYLTWVVKKEGTKGGQAIKALLENHYGALPEAIQLKAKAGVVAENIKWE